MNDLDMTLEVRPNPWPAVGVSVVSTVAHRSKEISLDALEPFGDIGLEHADETARVHFQTDPIPAFHYG
jgi:hypothetical protein